MSLRELQEKRSRAIAEMRKITEAPAGQAGDLSDEQRTRFDTLKTEITTLEERIQRQTFIDEADRRAAGQPLNGSGDQQFDTAMRGFSLLRAIASQVPGLDVDSGRERELSQELARRSGRPFQGIAVPVQALYTPVEQRAVSTAPDTAGGYLVQTSLDGAQYIDRLRAALAVRRLGARVLSGLVGNLDLPRLIDSAATGWVNENQALTLSNPNFGKVSMGPRHCGGLTELSRQVLQQTSMDVENLVRSDLAQMLAAAVDKAAIIGSGAGAEPLGILNTPGIGSVPIGANGGPLSADTARDLIGLVDAADAGAGSLSFLTNTKVKAQALKLKDGEGRYLGLSTVFGESPVAFTNNVPSNLTKGTAAGTCSPLLYGNWSDLILGYWSELDILVNPFESTAYAKGNVQIRAMLTMDIAVRHAVSFAATPDIVTG